MATSAAYPALLSVGPSRYILISSSVWRNAFGETATKLLKPVMLRDRAKESVVQEVIFKAAPEHLELVRITPEQVGVSVMLRFSTPISDETAGRAYFAS